MGISNQCFDAGQTLLQKLNVPFVFCELTNLRDAASLPRRRSSQFGAWTKLAEGGR
jgi:hypothetical protein